ncbi:hypothetical protein ACFOWB_24965, partial [Chenggangzhangella methanolivorans]|uniref:hypothetical protein n=1 Tax=Chenggangzhangella methanolivorans TaxID=1437009 RepID=UPI00360DF443
MKSKNSSPNRRRLVKSAAPSALGALEEDAVRPGQGSSQRHFFEGPALTVGVCGAYTAAIGGGDG